MHALIATSLLSPSGRCGTTTVTPESASRISSRIDPLPKIGSSTKKTDVFSRNESKDVADVETQSPNADAKSKRDRTSRRCLALRVEIRHQVYSSLSPHFT